MFEAYKFIPVVIGLAFLLYILLGDQRRTAGMLIWGPVFVLVALTPRRDLAFVSFNSSIDWVAYLIGMVITLSVFLLGAIPVALQKYMNSRKREE